MLALLIASLLGGWMVSSAAGLPKLPIPPPPTVPTLPLLPPPPHVPPIPPVSIPAPPAVSHPALPTHVPAPNVPSSLPVSGPHSSARPARRANAAPTKVYRLRFSRDWIARTGPNKRRQTILSFVLQRPALIEFVVFQIYPDCLRIGRFRVHGRRGLNQVRFRGRIGRRVLGPGTYRIKARAVSGRRTLAEKRLVIVSRANKTEIAAARGADACAASHDVTTRSSNAERTGASREQPSTRGQVSGKTTSKPLPSRSHGVLGARFTRKAIDAIKKIPLWLFVLLGLAIALLAVAALPLQIAPNGRVAAVLAHRRGLITLAGTAALVAVTVAYVLH